MRTFCDTLFLLFLLFHTIVCRAGNVHRGFREQARVPLDGNQNSQASRDNLRQTYSEPRRNEQDSDVGSSYDNRQRVPISENVDSFRDHALPASDFDGQDSNAKQDSQSEDPFFDVDLTTSSHCSTEVRRYCSHHNNTMVIFRCLFFKREDNGHNVQFSSKCLTLLWNMRRAISTSRTMVTILSDVCAIEGETGKNARLVDMCRLGGNVEGADHILQTVTCVTQNVHLDTTVECSKLIQDLAVIAFSHLEFIDSFIRKCQNDVTRFNCGRIGLQDYTRHGQSAVLKCLWKHQFNLKPDCKNEILSLAQLQSDDYHLDMPLYMACKQYRHTLCANVRTGEGRVYQCLEDNVGNVDSKCAEAIERRQAMVLENYHVSRQFTDACHQTFVDTGCDTAGYQDHEFFKDSRAHDRTKVMRIASMIMCLDNHAESSPNEKLDANCLKQINKQRNLLMNHYSLTPELTNACRDDIINYCSQYMNVANGSLISCLVDASLDKSTSQQPISDQCTHELSTFLRLYDFSKVWIMDPAARAECVPLGEYLCNIYDNNPYQLYRCLVAKWYAKQMTESCRRVILRLQYFVIRDFHLDKELASNCHNTAVTQCNANSEWFEQHGFTTSGSMLVLSCLYQLVIDQMPTVNKSDERRVPDACAADVLRVMDARADDVGLYPDLQHSCMTQLASLCSKKHYTRMQEMDCLLSNYNNLKGQCRADVSVLIKDRAVHVRSNPEINAACSHTIDTYCQSEYKGIDSTKDSAHVLNCLISLKMQHTSGADADIDVAGSRGPPRISYKCVAAVSHFQLITQQDFRLNSNFVSVCGADISRLCPHKYTVSQVVSCISSKMLSDVMGEKKELSVSIPCSYAVMNQLNIRQSDPSLDVELAKACSVDIEAYCVDHSTVHRQPLFECLRAHTKSLYEDCRQLVLRRLQIQHNLPHVDFHLQNTCSGTVSLYCDLNVTAANNGDIIQCLANVLDRHGEQAIGAKCLQVMKQRWVEQISDYRLNPALNAACSSDMRKHCGHIITLRASDSPLEGRMSECLGGVYRRGQLEERCAKFVAGLMETAVRDIQLDPVLRRVCASEISLLCTDMSGQQQVTCIREKVMQGAAGVTDQCLRYVALVVTDVDLDIRTDVQLSRACALDLLRHCPHAQYDTSAQFECLLTLTAPTARCEPVLNQRIKMVQAAKKILTPKTVNELATIVYRDSWLTFLFSFFLLAIVLIAIMCGRVSNRILAENKRK